ncbi:DUF4097 family beta strand repeat protein [Clostridium sp. 19966]|uniref:DUF4097 family beta strand repeat-containing protein n=1 Tax=Clostridium sp. 19966 TaxID=2768166 RepID=UPI0028DFA843|nr:DUF4097 family beta strand repeat-containing protein [Clostridium sp. 19966]MDT8718356.1 DUF4097 family beta strand repeat protein [Clostridium sp. 19966]
MYKRRIKVLIAFFSLMVIIMIAMLCYLIINNGVSLGTSTIQKEAKESVGNYSNINLDFTSADIKIYSTDDNQLKVVEKSSSKLTEQEKFVVLKEGNSLDIKDGDKENVSHHSFINIFNLSFGKSIEVYIPKSYSKDLTINSTSGSIRFEEAMVLYNLKCYHTSGSFKAVDKITANEFYIDASSGSIELQALECKKYDIKVTSGEIKLGKLSGSGDVKSSSGSIDVDYKSIDEYSNVEATSGSIKLNLSQEINFDFQGQCTSGSINGNIDMNFQGYRKNKAEAKVGNSPYKNLRASTSSGSIRIDLDK